MPDPDDPTRRERTAEEQAPVPPSQERPAREHEQRTREHEAPAHESRDPHVQRAPHEPAVPAREEPRRPSRQSHRDPRAMIVAVAGLVVVLLIALGGFLLLPDPVAEGVSDTKGAYIVAIASAALTAVGTMVTAYIAIKAANVAREDVERSSLRHEIRTAALAGAAPSAAAHEANREATTQIQSLGL